MRKLIVFFWCLILVSCTDNPEPEPQAYQLTDVSVAGGLWHDLGKEVSLFIQVKDIPAKTNWSLIYKIDGNVIHVEPLPKGQISFINFHGFTPTIAGTYEFHGCLSNGNSEVCQRAGFVIRE